MTGGPREAGEAAAAPALLAPALLEPLGRVAWAAGAGAGVGARAIEAPPDGVAGVWLAAPEPGHAEAVAPWLSAAERERRDRFLHAGARGQFLTGRWLLRAVAAGLLGVAPADVVLRELERGALALAGPAGESGWHLNLSHTDGLVAVAAARTPVGVDVEDAERTGRTVELSDRFFAPREAAALRALPPAAQRERFFALWTLKEAYIKARGLGLAIPLASFAFDLDAPALGFTVDAAVEVNRGEDAGRWRFARGAPTARHRLALALAR